MKEDWLAVGKTWNITRFDRIKLHGGDSMTAARFGAYRDGMTVARYYASGGTAEDLALDRARGHISVHDPDSYRKLMGLGPAVPTGRPTRKVAYRYPLR